MSMNKVWYPMTDNNMMGLAKIPRGERSEMLRTTEYMQAERAMSQGRSLPTESSKATWAGGGTSFTIPSALSHRWVTPGDHKNFTTRNIITQTFYNTNFTMYGI